MRMKNTISLIAAIAFLTGPLGQAVKLSEKDSGKIARVVGFLLSNTHFKRTPLNDDISQAFLRKYMESLDYSRMVFLQPDYDEFEAKYGTLLDNLTKRGDVSPALVIHKRYFTRLKTAHGWLEDILWTDFDFTIDESFVANRTKADWPGNEEEARDLWRKRVKYEVLGTRLGKRRGVEAMKAKANNGEVVRRDDDTPVKPYDIKTEKEKILRRYERFLRVRTEMTPATCCRFT